MLAESCDTLIFLKDGRYFDSVIEMLSDAGFKEDSIIAIAQDLSSDGEVMLLKKLEELTEIKRYHPEIFFGDGGEEKK